DKDVVRLSKLLSKTLRHQAKRMGLNIRTDGRVAMDELLAHNSFRGVTVGQVMQVAEDNDKKRFEVEEINGVLMIRAAQGHTIKTISDEELLTEVTDAAELPVCVHGTYRAALPAILSTGLNRMKRNHIHMAVGLPGAFGVLGEEVVSGMRGNCDVLLFVDVANAMQAGVRFFRSSNGVVLTKGVRDSGVLPAEFLRV
ncbi:phosphotransferase KptA/Tpt1, partial [Ochromonadaceae sp. CCMP2298]